ncbi:MAG TPA: hypothetical protein VF236_00800 [Gaiellaceae bacterium]
MRVATGALDDGRGYWRQLALALLGWLLTAALVVWLSLHAGEIALRVTLFLVSLCVFVALLAVALAVVVFRPPLMRARREGLDATRARPALDALGRPAPTALRADLLEGEITIEGEEGGRRYVTRGAET